jgi:hypothetical protein
MAQIFNSYGRIAYRADGWITLYCCSDLARYYQAQIKEKPRCIEYPMHGSHITIANGRWESIPNMGAWRKYQNKEVRFTYSNKIVEDHRFYFLTVRCKFIDKVRDELGLESLKTHKKLRRGLHLTLARKIQMEK